MLEEKLIHIVTSNKTMMHHLQLVRKLALPHWYIAAGYVRNAVWDYLHGHKQPTPLNDVDVIYFDPNDLQEQSEKQFEQMMKNEEREVNWSFKNQARMHIRNHHEPYKSVEDAVKRWPETATAVGITLTENGSCEVIAPHGLHDLFHLIVRKSDYFDDVTYFHKRIKSKNWLQLWPRLIVIE